MLAILTLSLTGMAPGQHKKDKHLNTITASYKDRNAEEECTCKHEVTESANSCNQQRRAAPCPWSQLHTDHKATSWPCVSVGFEIGGPARTPPTASCKCSGPPAYGSLMIHCFSCRTVRILCTTMIPAQLSPAQHLNNWHQPTPASSNNRA
jgi:hypothetical protein